MASPLPLPATGEPIDYPADMADALNEAVEDRLPSHACVYGEGAREPFTSALAELFAPV